MEWVRDKSYDTIHGGRYRYRYYNVSMLCGENHREYAAVWQDRDDQHPPWKYGVKEGERHSADTEEEAKALALALYRMGG